MPNHLSKETSPYLLQHANNPVDWFPWGKDAFEKAKRENKPVIVSIGYSTCHWCHVMERESFENTVVADYMNQHFVNIKVDREERPDIDQIYMEVCQLINGSGGWPLNVFLKPNQEPFFAGTYYPPQSLHNRPSWMQLLQHLNGIYHDKPDLIEEQTEKIMSILKKEETSDVLSRLDGNLSSSPSSGSKLQKIADKLEQGFDRQYGGFGGAPKFPSTMSLDYLLVFGHHFEDETALDHVHFSLKKMIFGGIYDQIGGGFSRYATDKEWLVPHFEKMLYDNALLMSLLSDAFKVTGIELYKDTILETVSWLKREMLSDEGAFYSALDADSEGVEGKYYVWDANELKNILKEDYELFANFYGVTEFGNWEGKNILYRKETIRDYAQRNGLDPSEFKSKLENAGKCVLKEREKRVAPGLDNKILTDWNALMISSLLKGAGALGIEELADIAINAYRFLELNMIEKNEIYHVKNSETKIPGFLDDYSFFIQASLDLFEYTQERKYLQQAEYFATKVFELFNTPSNDFFYFTSKNQETLITRRVDLFDNATPSGNSTMLHNLYRLSRIIDAPNYKSRVEVMLGKIEATLQAYPTAVSNWAKGYFFNHTEGKEIAVLGEHALDFQKDILKQYLPNTVILANTEADDNLLLLKGRFVEGKTLIYLCENFQCKRPFENIDQLIKELGSKVL
ncbi:MAG: thioredoxin domain-containing protein [Saprospiraceae bacterium]